MINESEKQRVQQIVNNEQQNIQKEDKLIVNGVIYKWYGGGLERYRRV